MSVRDRIDSVRDTRPTPTETWEYAMRLDACWRRGQLIPSDDATALREALSELETLDSTRTQTTDGLAKQVARETDDLIFKAIDDFVDDGFSSIQTLHDISRRGHMTCMPDGTEIFAYDGVALIKFWPVILGTQVEAGYYTVKASRKYQKLV